MYYWLIGVVWFCLSLCNGHFCSFTILYVSVSFNLVSYDGNVLVTFSMEMVGTPFTNRGESVTGSNLSVLPPNVVFI